MKNLSILLLFITLSAWAQEEEKFDPNQDDISDKYEAGMHLIYDCEEDHWVCVRQTFFKECENKRAQGLLKQDVQLKCAPIGAMASKKACYQRVLFLTTHNHGTRFCLNDKWKNKAY